MASLRAAARVMVGAAIATGVAASCALPTYEKSATDPRGDAASGASDASEAGAGAAGNGGASGSAGGSGDCADAVDSGDDCGQCICEACTEEFLSCFATPGCGEIFGCVATTFCDPFNPGPLYCNNPEWCGPVLGMHGGVGGEAFMRLQDLGNCAFGPFAPECGAACGGCMGPDDCDTCATCWDQCTCEGGPPSVLDECNQGCCDPRCDCTGDPCTDCLCTECEMEYNRCATHPSGSCLDIVDCITRNGCFDAGSCYAVPECQTIIDSAGGPSGTALQDALDLIFCPGGAVCPCAPGGPPGVQCGNPPFECFGETRVDTMGTFWDFEACCNPNAPGGGGCGLRVDGTGPYFPTNDNLCLPRDPPLMLDSSCPRMTTPPPGHPAPLDGCCLPEGICGYAVTELPLGCVPPKFLGVIGPPPLCN